jgi:hypothetical protein
VLGPVAKATMDALADLAQASSLPSQASPEGFFDLFGLSEWSALGERYVDYEGAGR